MSFFRGCQVVGVILVLSVLARTELSQSSVKELSVSEQQTRGMAAPPKFRCEALCTDLIKVCNSLEPAVTCGDGTGGTKGPGSLCGTWHISKKDYEKCVQDPTGPHAAPCDNDQGPDPCYKTKRCLCKAVPAGGGVVIYTCEVPPNEPVKDTGNVMWNDAKCT